MRFYAYECKAKLKPLQWFQWTPDRAGLLTAGFREFEEPPPAETPPQVRGVVDLWRPVLGARTATFDVGGYSGFMSALAVGFDAKGTWALSSGPIDGLSRPLVAWNLASGATTILGGHLEQARQVEVSPDGALAVVLSGEDQLVSVDLTEPTILATAARRADGSATLSIHFSKDGRTLLEQVSLKGLDRRDPRTLEIKGSSTGFLDVSPDGALMFGSSDGTLGIFDALTGDLLHETPPSEIGSFSSSAFSPDNTRLAVVGDRLIVVDVKTGRRIAENASGGYTAEWTPDGRVLSTGDRIWNAETWDSKEIADTFVLRRAKAGHLVDRFEGETMIELDGLTLAPTGARFDLKGGAGDDGLPPTYDVSEDGAFITFLNVADQTVRVLRTKDHALLDLGVAFVDGVPHGWAATPTGGYDGPEAATGCAPKTGKGRRVVAELMKRFFSGQPVE